MTYQLLPPLSQTEYESLKASINEHGVLSPIEVDENGEILDGHHRIRVCKELGINSWPTVTKTFGSELEKQAYVYMVNLARRQVSRDQLKEIREEQKKLAYAFRKRDKTQEEIAGMIGLPEGTIARWSGEFAGLDGESLYRAIFAHELQGEEEVQSDIGRIDILTSSHAFEVEHIKTWKHGLGQAIAYAQTLGLQPGLALYGPQPSEKKWSIIYENIKANNVKLVTKFWERPNKLPGRLIKAWAEGRKLTDTQRKTLAEFGIYGKPSLLVSSYEETNKIVPLVELRTSISQRAKDDIFERSQQGDRQAQIASDYGISQGRVSQIVKEEKKKGKKKAKQEAKASQPKPRIIIPTLMVGDAGHLSLDSETIDVIITSPRYNLGVEKWPMGGQGRQPRENGIGYEDSTPEEEYQKEQIAWLSEWYRVAKSGASLFYNHKVRQKEGEMIHPLDWLRSPDNPWILRQEIVWDRESTHNHCPSLFWPQDERVYWMTKGKPIIPKDGIGLPSVWRFHGPEPDTWHPAPFPEDLPKRCLKAIGRSGIVILDPCGGRMTTCRVASQIGYQSIGIDINPDYVERAKKENGWMSTSET